MQLLVALCLVSLAHAAAASEPLLETPLTHACYMIHNVDGFCMHGSRAHRTDLRHRTGCKCYTSPTAGVHAGTSSALLGRGTTCYRVR
jgi:hypothetical protein